MSKAVTSIGSIENPVNHEEEYVHEVYDQIASHFSSTRYKPWPLVVRFLQSIPNGSVGLDLGTGNGKYLPLPTERPGKILTIGLDRSRNLLEIAKHAGSERHHREVVLGNVLDNCWRSGCMDYAISIATIHHLSTAERRKEAVKSLLRCLSPSHGRALLYVWAIQQDSLSKRAVPTETDGSEGRPKHGEDVFVPWVMASKQNKDGLDESSEHTFNRYYHMFDQGELRSLVCEAAEEMGITIKVIPDEIVEQHQEGGRFMQIVQDGWERSNYYLEIRLWQR